MIASAGQLTISLAAFSIVDNQSPGLFEASQAFLSARFGRISSCSLGAILRISPSYGICFASIRGPFRQSACLIYTALAAGYTGIMLPPISIGQGGCGVDCGMQLCRVVVISPLASMAGNGPEDHIFSPWRPLDVLLTLITPQKTALSSHRRDCESWQLGRASRGRGSRPTSLNRRLWSPFYWSSARL